MNKYGPKAQREISKTLHKYKTGTLKSGNSDQPVKSKRQAVAIGISKARAKHYKVPNTNAKRGG